ncbi:hypothetical protein ACU4GD_30090 [Cupriavidus basilensis]
MPVEDQASGDELARIARRRRQLGIARRIRDGDGNWAVALSGGGIRSATFCLGVMQALAKAPPPPVAGAPGAALHDVKRDGGQAATAAAMPDAMQDAVQEGDGPAPALTAPPPATTALLGQFDYLSTVSGGGYLGAFFCSLFVPGRLKPGTTPPEAAALAYRTLRQEPPGRIRSSVSYAADPRPRRRGVAARERALPDAHRRRRFALRGVADGAQLVCHAIRDRQRAAVAAGIAGPVPPSRGGDLARPGPA